jgi:23S rRNA pseudouridine2604 synthase
MCNAVGLQVVAMKRLRVGRISLSRLPPGEWRYLAPQERI